MKDQASGDYMEQPEAPVRPRGTRLVIRIGLQALLVTALRRRGAPRNAGGVLFAYAGDLPEISALDNYQPNTITRVVARDGQVIGEFATERRVVDRLRRHGAGAPPGHHRQRGRRLRAALRAQRLAHRHHRRQGHRHRPALRRQHHHAAARAHDLPAGVHAGRRLPAVRHRRTGTEGQGSDHRDAAREAVHQARNLHVLREPDAAAWRLRRRVRRARLLRQAGEGADARGGRRDRRDIQTPARLNPFDHPDRNLAQRNSYVLPRMAEEGFITREEADEAAARPLVLRRAADTGTIHRARTSSKTSARSSRRSTAPRHSTRAGCGCRRPSTRSCSRRPTRRSIAGCGASTNAATGTAARRATSSPKGSPSKRSPSTAGRIRFSPATSCPRSSASSAPAARASASPATTSSCAPRRLRGRGGRRRRPCSRSATSSKSKCGRSRASGPRELVLEQPPAVEGALLAIDNRTGQIRAMVGGFSFARSKFNRATQARRQVGSLFKPIVYTAAIDRGFTPVSVFIDEPVSYRAGPNQPPYQPLNYDRKFKGRSRCAGRSKTRATSRP